MAGVTRDAPYLVNPPCPVVFDGWTAYTNELGANGWELHMDQNLRHMRLGLVLRHTASGLKLWADEQDFDFMQHRYRTAGTMDRTRYPVFRVRNLASQQITVSHVGEVNYNFRAVETRPQWAMPEYKSSSLDDFLLFEHKGPEIISTPEKIARLMDQIHALNEPELQKIQERNRTRASQGQALEGRLIQHAQILSFA